MWFAEGATNKIGRIAPNGSITEFPIPLASSQPQIVTPGAAGYLWFSGMNANVIGRISTTGAIVTYPVPTALSHPYGVVLGPDGNIWFTESSGNKIGKLVPSTGAVTEYPLAVAGARPWDITVGPDHNLWFTQRSSSNIGRITTSGVVTQFPITGLGRSIVSAADGNLWYTNSSNILGRITTSGTSTNYSLASGANPALIAKGPDGNPWFTEYSSNDLRAMNLATLTLSQPLALHTASAEPNGVATGPDGNLWFTETGANNIGVLVFRRQTASSSAISFTAVGQSQQFYVTESNYGGTFTATSSNTTVATVAPIDNGYGFVVTANAVGSSTITVSDTMHNTSPVAVTVTTTTLLDQ